MDTLTGPKDSGRRPTPWVEEEKKNKRNHVVIPYLSGVSEKLRRIFNKHHILVLFKPSNTLGRKLVHPKDRTSKHKRSNLVDTVQCSEEGRDPYKSVQLNNH